METRSRTTKLIVKNVEMLENQKFDKFDKVLQWLDTLREFEEHQHPKSSSNGDCASQRSTNHLSQTNKAEDLFDSDSSVNTGMNSVTSFESCFK